jgi:hypothetical protein
MPTNVYLTNNGPRAVDLLLRRVGPSHVFDGHFHQLLNSVNGETSEAKVLSVDRGGDFHAGDAVGVGELQLWVSGIFVAALQVMLDNSTDPFKDAIHWSWRVPTTAEGRWDDSHDPLNVKYSTPAGDVSFTVQGRGTIGFDDIYLTLDHKLKGYTSFAAERDPQHSRLVSFATTQAGDAMIATAPMVAGGPPIACWQTKAISVDRGRRLVGSASVLVGLDGQRPTYAAAQTEREEVWLATDQGVVSYIALDLPSGAATSALSFSNIWLNGSQAVVDVFATATVSGAQRLYHRVLALAPLAWVGDWTDWDKVVVPPSYTASRDYRYLFSASPGGIIRGAGIYYTYASWGSTSWSSWSGLDPLPNGATAAALQAFAWYTDDKPQKEVGLLCTATDGRVYFFTFDTPPPKWTLAGAGIRGGVEVGAETNSSPLAARGETSLVEGFVWVKEHTIDLKRELPDTRTVGPFAIVNPYKRATDGGATVLRQSDDGLGPTSVSTGL